MGGNAALLELFSASFTSSFFDSVPKGVGAVSDMGGNMLPEAGLVKKGFLGAAVDMGGNAALLELFSASFTSSFFELEVEPTLPDANVMSVPPNETRPDPWPIVASLSAGLLTRPPNENPPEPMLLAPNALPPPVELVADGNADPNVNPLVPILPPDTAGLVSTASDGLPSSPGLGVSHAAHFVADGLFVTMHVPHFHEPSSDDLNVEPQPSALPSDAIAVIFLSESCSSTLSSPLSSSSLSPSPNNQSTYQSRKAFLVNTFSPDSSRVLIFLIVRVCSSSQYVVPIDSKSLLKSETGIFVDPLPSASKAFSAFAFSSAISLSCDESSPSWSTRLQYHMTKALLVISPVVLAWSTRVSCLSSSSP